jgi:transporter family-2 protein
VIGKTAILALIPVSMAFLAGVVLPFQAASNAAVGRALGSPLWGALTSLIVSAIVVIAAVLVMRVPAPDISKALQGSWWLWIGGVLGAIYVVGASALTPKLGAGGFLLLVVAGQITASVLVDHFGLMGLSPKPVNIAKLAGVILIFGGVFLVQSAGSTPTDKPSIEVAK